MNIVSIDETKYINNSVDGWNRFDIFMPSFSKTDGVSSLNVYIVQKGEDMRIDLVMMSIYDEYSLKDVDVILHINDIDNPLNIREGMELFYPVAESDDPFTNFRYQEISGDSVSKSIKSQLGVLNKTTRKDENRKKFLDSNYSLPPTVMRESRPSVTVSDGNIYVGGL
jgi:hypothetical protein